MEAFQQTKHALENFNKLSYTPDNPHTKLIMKIYALNHDVDIVIQEITKDIRPIAFLSAKLLATQGKYATCSRNFPYSQIFFITY